MELSDSNIELFRTEMQQFSVINKKISDLKLQIKPIQVKIKHLQAEKKLIEQEICNTMEINDLQAAKISEEVFERYSKKSMVPVNQRTIREKMIDFFEEGPGSLLAFNSRKAFEKGIDLFNYIYSKENRDFITKEELKIK